MTTHSSAAPPRGSPLILLLAREYRNNPCPTCRGGRQERVVSSISSLARIPLTAAATKRQALNNDHRQVIGLHRGQRQAPGRGAGAVRAVDEGSVTRPVGCGADLRDSGFSVIPDCLNLPGTELLGSHVPAQFTKTDLQQRILPAPARSQALPHHVLIHLGQRLTRREMPLRKFSELAAPRPAGSQRLHPASADAIHQLRNVRADDLHQEQAGEQRGPQHVVRDRGSLVLPVRAECQRSLVVTLPEADVCNQILVSPDFEVFPLGEGLGVTIACTSAVRMAACLSPSSSALLASRRSAARYLENSKGWSK